MEAEVRRVNDRVRALQNEADRLTSQVRTLLGNLRRIEVDRGLLIGQVRQPQAATAQGQITIADLATLSLEICIDGRSGDPVQWSRPGWCAASTGAAYLVLSASGCLGQRYLEPIGQSGIWNGPSAGHQAQFMNS